jgi:hypothetical protein
VTACIRIAIALSGLGTSYAHGQLEAAKLIRSKLYQLTGVAERH